MKGNIDVLEDDVLKLFIKYAIPSILGVLGMSSYVFFDTMFIGQGLGSEGLAALNIVLPVFSLFNATAFLFGMGGGAAISVCIGKKKYNKVNEIFTHALILSVIIGGIYTLIGTIFLDKLCYFLGADASTITLVKEYLRIIMAMSIGFVLVGELNVFVRNDKSPKLAMWSMIIPSLVNIVLDYIFIFPMGMGMKGAALATAISPVTSLLMLSTHFIKKESMLKLSFKGIKFGIMKRIILNGFPSFIVEISAGVVIFAFNIVISYLSGSIGLAAYGIIANVAIICRGVFNGTAQAIQPILSVNYGAEKYDRVKKCLFIARVTAFTLGGLFLLIGILFPRNLVNIFSNDGEKLVSITVTGIYIYFTSFLIEGINTVNLAYFQAVENVKSSSIISITRGFVGVFTGLIFLPQMFGLKGVWATVPFSESVTFIVSITCFLIFDKVITKNKISLKGIN